MKKQVGIVFLLIGLIFVSFSFSTDALAITHEISYVDGQNISESNTLDKAYFTYTTEELSAMIDNTVKTFNPLADEFLKPKTVTKFYSNYDSIRDFTSHSEFNEGFWWYGTLLLVKAEKVSNGWVAKYSGQIYTYTD